MQPNFCCVVWYQNPTTPVSSIEMSIRKHPLCSMLCVSFILTSFHLSILTNQQPTPWKINMEPKVMEVWFRWFSFSNLVIFRFLVAFSPFTSLLVAWQASWRSCRDCSRSSCAWFSDSARSSTARNLLCQGDVKVVSCGWLNYFQTSKICI